MTTNISKQEIKSFKQAKRCALNDMTSKEKRLSKQLDDNQLFSIIKSNDYENKQENTVYDSNIISADTINKFHSKISQD